MIDLITPANFEFFARYLLAGLIIIWVRASFVVGERPRLTEMVVEAVVLSLVNQLVFMIVSPLAAFLLPALPERLRFLGEVLLLPATLGLTFGIGLARGWNSAIFRRLSMPVQGPRRRAYDHAFTLHETEGFVIVTFTDGTKVYGYFGENSLAANDAARSDLYLERIYDVGEDGQWRDTLPPRGALLSLSDLRSVEFLEMEGASP